ncbi:unnamed protein product [Adineta steineri]|uniref:VWFA domain-containing protein n=1 Tax=Adineta steineri TaxID=433720 RepID=A0A819SKZ0_9BILA|nr:unnamed protein product [Adineta steineri]CAF4064588.1 unnamed protein product [Adineta steineri]
MKTYLKRPHDKSFAAVFYSHSDTHNQVQSRANFRQQIVQPSTKEQQRLLSSTNLPRLQHVHSGKYGIKPIWSSDDSLCEQWQHGKKFNKHRSSISSENHQDRCSQYTSDSKKTSIFSLTTILSYVNQEYGLILLLASISLLLLLLVYIVYRQRSTKINENKLNGQQQQRRRLSLEENLFSHNLSEHRLSAVPVLPTIVEENSPALHSSSSASQFSLLSSSTNATTSSTTVIDNNDTHNSSSPSTHEEKSSINNIPTRDNVIRISLLPKDEQSTSSGPRRRSRFEQNPTTSTAEKLPIEDALVPPVIVRKTSITHQNVIKDDYASLEEVNNAVKEVGLHHSQLMFGIDYTISNLETGKHSFNGLSLHHIQNGLLNPYQSVITIVGRTLEKYDSDMLIPAFGFGDRSTLDRKIFPLRPDGTYCKGFRGVLDAYNEITPRVRMSGPTNFAPLIREAIRIVKKTGQYHILVIVADGQVTNEKQTKDAIVEASNYPLSIVMIGVGDGPWDMMEEFDDSLPTRQFDNFQFVNYNSVVEASTNTDSSFALRALMEIPSQYAAIKELGLLKNS